jgi:hypothetical protein
MDLVITAAIRAGEKCPSGSVYLIYVFDTNGKMQYNPGWESGSMKTLAAHGLAGGIVQDRMGGSFGAGFLSGSLGSYLGIYFFALIHRLHHIDVAIYFQVH